MNIPKHIVEKINKLAKIHSKLHKLDNELFEWLDKNNVTFDPLDKVGCAYASIQDGFSDGFIDALKELKE